MKLLRFGERGSEKPGFVNDLGEYLDLSNFIPDYDSMFFEEGGLENLTDLLNKHKDFPKVLPNTRLGPPVKNPSKLVCVGVNYARHAKESGLEIPKEPVLFFKATTAICGPNDDLIIPPGSEKTDWEVELGVVIGKRASYIEEKNAMDYVAGYVIHNDYSERNYQLERSGQWVKGKSCDTFAPIGPYLVTRDEIRDPQDLNLWLKLNGKMMQNGNSSDMVYKIPFLVSYISNFMTLLPGDIISTGTPFGVGLGFNPQIFIRPGDVIELGINGLGTAKQKAVAYRAK